MDQVIYIEHGGVSRNVADASGRESPNPVCYAGYQGCAVNRTSEANLLAPLADHGDHGGDFNPTDHGKKELKLINSNRPKVLPRE